MFSSDALCNANSQFNKSPIPAAHSSAFVDIDGDCVNDLIIMSETSQNLNSVGSKAAPNADGKAKLTFRFN